MRAVLTCVLTGVIINKFGVLQIIHISYEPLLLSQQSFWPLILQLWRGQNLLTLILCHANERQTVPSRVPGRLPRTESSFKMHASDHSPFCHNLSSSAISSFILQLCVDTSNISCTVDLLQQNSMMKVGLRIHGSEVLSWLTEYA